MWSRIRPWGNRNGVIGVFFFPTADRCAAFEPDIVFQGWNFLLAKDEIGKMSVFLLGAGGRYAWWVATAFPKMLSWASNKALGMCYRVACKRWRGVMAPRARATMASVSPQPLLNNTWGFGVLWEYSSLNGRLLASVECFHDGLGFSWYSWTNMQPLCSSISLPAFNIVFRVISQNLQHCTLALFFFSLTYREQFCIFVACQSRRQSLLPNVRLCEPFMWLGCTWGIGRGGIDVAEVTAT